jgi:hypothetical protein
MTVAFGAFSGAYGVGVENAGSRFFKQPDNMRIRAGFSRV